MVICCPREGRGGRNAQVPQEGDPPGPQQLGCFPSTPHPARVRSVCGAGPPQALQPASWPPRGDVSLHSSPPLLQVHPVVPSCLKQAGLGTMQATAPGTGTDTCRWQPPKHNPASEEALLNPPDLAGMLSRSPGMSQAGPASAGARI